MRTQVSGIQSTALVLCVGFLTSSLSIPGKLVKKANSQAPLTETPGEGRGLGFIKHAKGV